MKQRLIYIALAGFFGLTLLAVAGLALHWRQNRQPTAQPIAFPHTIHAGRLGLACDFCHESVAEGRHAGAPPVSKCLSCHETIAADRPEIVKLKEYRDRGEPIRWQRLHALPEFIYFSHKRHVKTGLDCAACHGDIAAMPEVHRVRSLKMGWCITCHRARGASLDCATCHR
jgi:hypothetical protein